MGLIERLRISVAFDTITLRRHCKEAARALEAAEAMAKHAQGFINLQGADGGVRFPSRDQIEYANAALAKFREMLK